jgi:hypothetical protein
MPVNEHRKPPVRPTPLNDFGGRSLVNNRAILEWRLGGDVFDTPKLR